MWPRTVSSEAARQSRFPHMFRNAYMSVIPARSQRERISVLLSVTKSKLDRHKSCHGTAIEADRRFEAPTPYGSNCDVSQVRTRAFDDFDSFRSTLWGHYYLKDYNISFFRVLGKLLRNRTTRAHRQGDPAHPCTGDPILNVLYRDWLRGQIHDLF